MAKEELEETKKLKELSKKYNIFTCDKCNMQFQGDKKGEDTSILVYEHTDIPLLMATKLEYTKSYVLKQWCNGKKV